MPGSNVNLTCVAAGSPVPFVSWKKGNIELNPKDSGLPIGKNVLTLIDVQESDNYTCIAQSKHGSKEAVAQVIVRSLPRPPPNLLVSDVTPTSVRISWNYEHVPENIIYFVLQYKPKAGQMQEISGITTSFYILNSLLPYTEYEFYIIAVNNIGRGQASTPLYVTTGESSKFTFLSLIPIPMSTLSLDSLLTFPIHNNFSFSCFTFSKANNGFRSMNFPYITISRLE